jgi:hypothetical protein
MSNRVRLGDANGIFGIPQRLSGLDLGLSRLGRERWPDVRHLLRNFAREEYSKHGRWWVTDSDDICLDKAYEDCDPSLVFMEFVLYCIDRPQKQRS